jgi:RNA polymerase sigma factor (sigma-70 family)
MAEVKRVARRVRQMFTHYIQIEDLEQAGYLGLVSASDTYDPRTGPFPNYAYWRIRGEMIDSQKRRTFREAANLSLTALAETHDGRRWLPPSLDTCPRPLQDEMAERDEIHAILQRAITALPPLERRVLRGHLAGDSLTLTARDMGRSLTWTRAKLAEARQTVGVAVRGE